MNLITHPKRFCRSFFFMRNDICTLYCHPEGHVFIEYIILNPVNRSERVATSGKIQVSLIHIVNFMSCPFHISYENQLEIYMYNAILLKLCLLYEKFFSERATISSGVLWKSAIYIYLQEKSI